MKTEIDEILAEMEAEDTPIEVITTDLVEPATEEIMVEIEIPAEEMEDDVLVESKPVEEPKFAVGDEVKLVAGAKFASGGSIPESLFNTKLYVRQIKNDNYAISSKPTGRISGSVKPSSIVAYTKEEIVTDGFDPYLVLIRVENLDIKSKPIATSKTLKTIHFNGLYTIVGEKDGWGHMKIGGWIPLDCVRKLV